MIWNLMFLIFYIVLALGAGRLFCSAPDWVQKAALFCVILGALIFVGYYGSETLGDGTHWIVKVSALYFFQFAVAIHVFRLVIVEMGICKSCLPQSRPHLA